MKRSFLVAAIALLCLSGCEKDKISVPSDDAAKIFGRWEWLSTTGGFSGEMTTPALTGQTLTIAFSNDGSYKEVRVPGGTSKQEFQFGGEFGNEQVIVGGRSFFFSFQTEDTLRLAEENFSHLYLRLPLDE